MSDPSRSPDRTAWLWFGVVVLVFLPALGGEFLSWDDPMWITANPLVSGDGDGAWAAIWTRPYQGSWYPLYLSVLRVLHGIAEAADGALGGRWDRWGGMAIPFHGAGVLLFAAAAVLWYEVLRELGIGRWGRALGVVWFALHPLRVESVVWASALRDTLSLASLLLALRWHLGQHRGLRNWAAPLAFAAAVLCKSMLFALAPLPLMLDVLWRGRPWRECGLRAIPYAAIAAMGIAGGYLAYRPFAGQNQFPADTLLGSLPVIGSMQLRYLRLQLVPHDLAAVPSAPDPSALGWITLAVAGVLLVVAAVWAARGRRRPLLIASWYTLPMLPVCGLLPLAWPIADRYTLLPSLAVALALAWAVDQPRLVRTALPLVAAAALVWTPLTVAHTRHWQNSEALWTHSLRHFPDEFVAHQNLAGVLGGEERWDECIEHLVRALELVDGLEPRATELTGHLLFADLLRAGVPLGTVELYRTRYREGADDPAALRRLANNLEARGLVDSVAALRDRADGLTAP